MKQTAVEWLAQEINKINISTEARMFINKLEKQAKEMEKQQIINSYASGYIDGVAQNKITAEQYYIKQNEV
jgi:hypothetical protein